jgi:hypothetical protein
MYKRIVVIFSLAVFGLATGVAGAAGFSSLEERMSQSEFHAAGLDKLSPAELSALNEWMRAHNAAPTIMVTPSGQPVFYAKDSDRELIEDRINGSFSGWRGHSVFTLENGQEWTQAESGSSACGPIERPKVKIKPMLLGGWMMYAESCSEGLRVTRTK